MGQARVMGPISSTSCSSSTSKRPRTHRRARETSSATSAERAPPVFSMKFACTREMQAPPMACPLRPQASMRRSGARALVGILEDRAERARLARLAVAAAALKLAHPRGDLLPHPRCKPQHGSGDDLGVAHVRMPVAELELARAACARTARRDDVGRRQDVADLAPVCAGVHAHGTAHRAGDGTAELDALERSFRAPADDGRQRCTTAAAHARALDLDRRERPLETHRNAVVPLVGHE